MSLTTQDHSHRHDAAVLAAVEAQGRGRFGLALDLYEEALDHAEALDDRRKIHAARINASSCYLSLGDWPSARSGLAAIVLESDEPRHVAAAASQLAEAHLKEGRLGKAGQYLRTAVDQARAAADPRREGSALVMTGHLAVHEGRLAEAETAYSEALGLYARLSQEADLRAGTDLRGRLALLHDYLGYARTLLGRHSEGLASLRRGLSLARAADHGPAQAEIHKDAAFCLMLAGRNRPAERHALRALALAQQHECAGVVKNTCYVLMELSLRGDREADFERWFSQLQALLPDVTLSRDFFRIFDISDVINLKEL